jgi:hypothetical protein
MTGSYRSYRRLLLARKGTYDNSNRSAGLAAPLHVVTELPVGSTETAMNALVTQQGFHFSRHSHESVNFLVG